MIYWDIWWKELDTGVGIGSSVTWLAWPLLVLLGDRLEIIGTKREELSTILIPRGEGHIDTCRWGKYVDSRTL